MPITTQGESGKSKLSILLNFSYKSSPYNEIPSRCRLDMQMIECVYLTRSYINEYLVANKFQLKAQAAVHFPKWSKNS
jgi:hypothetical protein